MLTHWMSPQFNVSLDPVIRTPKFEVIQKDLGVTIQADVPGLKSEDLDIKVEDRTLTIKGTRKGRGTFTRTYQLADSLDTEEMSAKLEDGVLTLELPKLARALPKKIPILTRESVS